MSCKCKKKDQEPDLYSVALEEIKQLGMFSFSLEEKREANLISQATQMLTAFSIFSAAILMALPVLLQYTAICKEALLLWTGGAFVPLIASLCLAIVAQWRYSYCGLKDIAAIKKHIYDNIHSFDKKSKYDDFWTLQIEPVHRSIMKNNDKRVFFVKASMSCFLFSIAILVFAAAYFILSIQI